MPASRPEQDWVRTDDPRCWPHRHGASVAEVDTDFTIEGSPRFLKAEVVVKLRIGEVAAFEWEVVAPVAHRVTQSQIIGKLVRHHVIWVGSSEVARIVAECFGILIVICQRQHIPLAPQVMPVEADIGVGKHVRQVRHTLPIGQIGHTAPGGGAHVVAHVHQCIVAP